MKPQKKKIEKAKNDLVAFKNAWNGLISDNIPMNKDYYVLKALVELAIKQAEEKISEMEGKEVDYGLK